MPLDEIIGKSDWLMDLINPRLWEHFYLDDSDSGTANTRYGAWILFLISKHHETPSDLQAEYWNWIEHKYLIPLRTENADLYAWLVAQVRDRIGQMADLDLET